MKVATVGIDLAKNEFQIHAVNEHVKNVLKKQLERDQVAEFFVNLPPCLSGMEACGSAHHGARKLASFGRTVKLMALHRVHQGFVKVRTAQANQIRALIGEFGLVTPQGIANSAKRVPELIEDASNELSGSFRQGPDGASQGPRQACR